ncbi:MAG: phosphonate C-P lyase system protein PhnH [Betaproteobacteria bacterium]
MPDSLSHDMQAWTASSQQHIFRQLMRAFSYPGRIETLATSGAHALTLTLAALIDRGSSLADPQNLLDDLTRQRLQTPLTVAERAHFVVADGTRPPAFTPALGSLESPEHGATIVLTVVALGVGTDCRLEGPGIAGSQSLAVTGLEPSWIAQRRSWNSAFPLGVDIILLDTIHAVALPRTTRITLKGTQPWAT